MTNTATKTYLVGVIERAIAYFEVEAEDARTAAENWQDGDFQDRDDEALESEGACSVREQQPDGTWKKLPGSQWEDPLAPATSGLPARFEIVHGLAEHGDRIHVLVDGKFDVAIVRTDEGVVVDVFPKQGHQTVATTYAFDSDVEPDADQPNEE